MSPAIIGLLAGIVLAIINYVVIMMIVGRMAQKSGDPKSAQTADILRKIALADLIVFPVVGYFLGPVLLW